MQAERNGGAIPSKHLTVKSRTSLESELSIKQILPKPCYQDINDLMSKMKLIKANEWANPT